MPSNQNAFSTTSDDRKLIAEIVQCSPKYVYYVLTGRRKADTERAKHILRIASAIQSFQRNLTNYYKA